MAAETDALPGSPAPHRLPSIPLLLAALLALPGCAAGTDDLERVTDASFAYEVCADGPTVEGIGAYQFYLADQDPIAQAELMVDALGALAATRRRRRP